MVSVLKKSRLAAVDLVPLAARVRHMRLFRLAAAVAVLAVAVVDRDGATAAPLLLAAVSAGYLALSAGLEWVWRRHGRRGLPLFGGLLIVDGVYLAWATYQTGGSVSPVRYVILLHLIAVALLASYRTSLKIALWHSLLVLVVLHAQRTGVLPDGGAAGDLELRRLLIFVAAFWLVALVTATFSAVNERELRRRRLDVETLARFAGEVEATGSPAAVAQTLLANLAEAFGFRRGVLIAAPSGTPRLLAQHGCDRPLLGDVVPDVGSVLERVKRRKVTLLAAALDHRADRWLATLMPGARNLVVVPLTSEEHCIGALVCEYELPRGSRVEQRVVTMVERFAAHTALALRNRWLQEEVRNAATTDGLTGIANRRRFDEALTQEISRSERTGEPVSLLLFDIDHFKHLNDTHGHQVGDDVLRELGAALAAKCRPFDVPARYGGEEFAVILPRCNADEAAAIGDRLRRAAATVTAAPITASGGVATFPEQAAGAESLISGADEALYRAKRSGRDRLCAFAAHRAEETEDQLSDATVAAPAAEVLS